MRAHREYEEEWVIGEFDEYGGHCYMCWGGDHHWCFIDGGNPEKAEKFDTAKEARDFMKKNEDAKVWLEHHPKAKVLRMVSGYTVYPPR